MLRKIDRCALVLLLIFGVLVIACTSETQSKLNASAQAAEQEMRDIFYGGRVQFIGTVKEVHMPSSWHRIVVYDDGTASWTYQIMDFYKGHGGWEMSTIMHTGFRFKATPSPLGFVPSIKNPTATDFMLFNVESYGL